jgi:hypothetical protein
MKLKAALFIIMICVCIIPAGAVRFFDERTMEKYIIEDKFQKMEINFLLVKDELMEMKPEGATLEMVGHEIAGERIPGGGRDPSTSNFGLDNGYGFVFDKNGNFLVHPFFEGLNYKEIPSSADIKEQIGQIVDGEILSGKKELRLDGPLETGEYRVMLIWEYIDSLDVYAGYIENVEPFYETVSQRISESFLTPGIFTVPLAVIISLLLVDSPINQ